MSYKEILKLTLINLLNAKFTAEYQGGETLLKFDGDAVFILGHN